MKKPNFVIDLTHLPTNPKHVAARKEAGATVAIFFPQGQIVVNAETPEDEIKWATLCGTYGMPAMIQDSIVAQTEEHYLMGRKDESSFIQQAILRAWPEQADEMFAKIDAELQAMDEEARAKADPE